MGIQLRDGLQSYREHINERPEQRDLIDFIRSTFPRYSESWHHRLIADKLMRLEDPDDELNRLIITMPPRMGKSELASVNYPAWFLGRNPDKRVIACSNTARLANRFSRLARNKVSHYQWAFPKVRLADDQANIESWDLQGYRGGYIAAGVGGQVTGFGADLILVDDAVKSAAQADSETYRENTWEWYTETLRTRLEPDGAICVIGTRWHEDDLIGRLMQDTDEGWEVINLPAINDAGESLWPSRWSVDELARIKSAVGSRAWDAQFMGRPSPQEGGILKRQWLRFWQHSGQSLPPVEMDGHVLPLHDLPGFFDEQLQSWDLAFTKTQSGSYVAGLTAGTLNAQCYLLDLFHERTDFPGTVEAFLRMSERWPDANVKLVEDKANGPALMDTLRSRVPGIVSVRPDGTKEARMHAVSPFVEGGGLILPHPRIAPWVQPFIDEIVTFPMAAHDDRTDALSQLLRRVATGTQTHTTDILAAFARELG